MVSENKLSSPKVSRDFFIAGINSLFISYAIPLFVCERYIGLCNSLTPLISPFFGYIIYYIHYRICSPDPISETIIKLKKDKKQTRKQLKDKYITEDCRAKLREKYNETCLKISSAHSDFVETENMSPQEN